MPKHRNRPKRGTTMQATKEIKERFLLEISREEAEWLKGLVQNPPGDIHPDNEDKYQAEMRSRYFHAIDRVLRPSMPHPNKPTLGPTDFRED